MHACSPMFIEALFTIAKTWKQPKCLSTGEWLEKTWYIYTMKYYSAIRKQANGKISRTWVDLDGVMLGEISQRKTYTICNHSCVEPKP